ncbi:MAG: peptidyl-prolyl cis-trans isomerase [Acidobacteriota bacterium]
MTTRFKPPGTTRSLLHLVAALVAGLLASCGGGPDAERDTAREEALADPSTIAVYDGGAIPFDALDEAILGLSPDERNAFGAGDLERYRRLARSLATDEFLRAEAVETGFATSPEHLTELDTMRRQVLVQHWLLTSPPTIETPTVDEIRERYDLSSERFGAPEKRFALSIFRHREPGQDPAPIVAELDALRKRVLAGENFSVLATEHSESESRHMSGAIGWVERGVVAPALEQLLFSLDESTPSEPIVTRDGVHLFYIETILTGEIPPIMAVEDTIRQTLVEERRTLAIEDLVVSTELPDDAFVPEREALDDLLTADDPTTLLLRVGTFELTLGDLRALVDSEQRRVDGEAVPSGELARALYNGIRRREVLHHRALHSGVELSPEIARRFDRQAGVFLQQRYSEHLIERALDDRDDALREFHATHRNRFVTLLELRLDALVVPHGDDPSQTMAALERHREALASGATTLDELADELGGRVQTSDWVDINQLGSFRAKAAFFAPTLAVGDISPPYNSGRAIELFRVLERREPEPLEFDDARDRVRRAYRERHGQEIYESLVAERLDAARFQLLDDRLEALVGASSGAPHDAPSHEISTDETTASQE